MNAPAQAALRRGWCPSTLRPMETGDGWLVRLHPPGGALTAADLAAIAALAARHGNGLVEISARANLQIRGVTAQTHPALVAGLLAQRLVDEHDGEGPQRLTLTSPMAGLSQNPSPHPEERSDRVASRRMFQDEGCGFSGHDLIDAAALACAIEASGRQIADLPAKTLVIVDGGGAMALDGFAADLRVLAVAGGQVAIGLPGGLWLAPVTQNVAPALVSAMLGALAAAHRAAPDIVRRMRDLDEAQVAALVAASGLCAMPTPRPRPEPRRVGLFGGDGSIAVILGLPFGRSDAATLMRLCAAVAPSCPIRLSPWRGIAFGGFDAASAEALLALAQTLGLIMRDDDPRLSVQACAGKPACERGQTDAMGDAAALATIAAPLLRAGVTLHVSACVKSCAHPGRAGLTLVGAQGRYDVVPGGATRDPALARLDLSEILRRLQPGQDLFDRLMAGQPMEPTA